MSLIRSVSRRTAVRTLLLACVAVAALPAVPAFASTCRGADRLPTSRNVRTARSATLCLLNHQRAAYGLRRLRAQRSLQSAAQRYARAMVAGLFFGHVSPSGSTLDGRIRKGTRYLAGALRWELGENLGWGQGTRAKPSQIVATWMTSPGHRANILRASFTEIGIGIAAGAPVAGVPGGVTYANEFGRRG